MFNIEESIRAAEEDIASWTKQKTTEDSRVRQEDIKEKNSIAQDLIREENDELKLIESHCNEDLNAISKYLCALCRVSSSAEWYFISVWYSFCKLLWYEQIVLKDPTT